MAFSSAPSDAIASNKAADSRDVYYPGSEDLGADEMRVVALGTGMPNARPKQAAACWLVELGNGDKFIFDMGLGAPHGDRLAIRIAMVCSPRKTAGAPFKVGENPIPAFFAQGLQSGRKICFVIHSVIRAAMPLLETTLSPRSQQARMYRPLTTSSTDRRGKNSSSAVESAKQAPPPMIHLKANHQFIGTVPWCKYSLILRRINLVLNGPRRLTEYLRGTTAAI